MTGQSLLDTMELLDQELQLQAGEADVTRGLLALNIAQDHLEAVISQERDVMGDGVGTVTTVANTETTAFPTGLLRLDGIQMLDANSKPEYDMEPIDTTGGHIYQRSWPFHLTNVLASAGKPCGYWTNARLIYWDRTPDAVYTLRWYGFSSAADITAAGTFAYPDIARLPVATMAVRLMRMGVGDSPGDVDSLASATFGAVVNAMAGFKREGPSGLVYTRTHTT